MSGDKFYYRCIDCGTVYDGNEIRYLCPHCAANNSAGMPPKGVLKVLYDYDALKTKETYESLEKKGFITR